MAEIIPKLPEGSGQVTRRTFPEVTSGDTSELHNSPKVAQSCPRRYPKVAHGGKLGRFQRTLVENLLAEARFGKIRT